MLELSLIQVAIVAFCAFLIGVTKTGLPGFSMLVVPLMAEVLPAKQSVGVLLGILILADLFAAGYHRRNARWDYILRLLPAAVAGIIVGFFLMGRISNELLQPVIGVIVLVMLGLNFWRNSRKDMPVPDSRWFAVAMGFAAGVTTMMANAAGPVMLLYLIAMKLPKAEFIGTRAWFFFVVNWLKVPFGVNLGIISAESVKFNLMMLPAIIIGSLVGAFLLKKIPQKGFRVFVQAVAVIAALKLMF